MAFDSSGEAYLFCLAFNRAPPASDVESFASALVLFRSANGEFRDRIYVAWSEFSADFSASPIAFAWSDDHGAT